MGQRLAEEAVVAARHHEVDDGAADIHTTGGTIASSSCSPSTFYFRVVDSSVGDVILLRT